MERPKIEFAPEERQVTGEIVYLDEMRHLAEFPKTFSQLDDETQAAYDRVAEHYVELGVRPDILKDYQEFDSEMSNDERSYIALADELLTHRNNEFSFIDICVDQTPSEVVDKLKQTRVGSILTGDDEQLAFESDGEYYPILDIKKKNAELRSVGVTVWGWDDDRVAFTDRAGEDRVPARDVLMYPEGEKINRREIDIRFGYNSPESPEHFSETVRLSVSEWGLSISRQVYVSAYAEMGYEGHHGKSMPDVQESDVADFGDLVADIVGDNPMSGRERQKQQYEQYLEEVTLAESVEYIKEWVDNGWDGQVMIDLERALKVDGVPLKQALATPDLSEKAHKVLVDHVDYKRLKRNKLAAKGGDTVLGYAREVWADGDHRSK